MRKLWLIVIFIASAIRNHALTVGQQSYSSNQASLLYQRAVGAVNRYDFAASLPLLQEAIALDPRSFQANQLLGRMLMKLANPEEGSLYLERAVELSEWKIPAIIADYIESLRMSRDLNRARDVIVNALDIHPNGGQVGQVSSPTDAWVPCDFIADTSQPYDGPEPPDDHLVCLAFAALEDAALDVDLQENLRREARLAQFRLSKMGWNDVLGEEDLCPALILFALKQWEAQVNFGGLSRALMADVRSMMNELRYRTRSPGSQRRD